MNSVWFCGQPSIYTQHQQYCLWVPAKCIIVFLEIWRGTVTSKGPVAIFLNSRKYSHVSEIASRIPVKKYYGILKLVKWKPFFHEIVTGTLIHDFCVWGGQAVPTRGYERQWGAVGPGRGWTSVWTPAPFPYQPLSLSASCHLYLNFICIFKF